MLRLVGLLIGFAGTILIFTPWQGSTGIPVGAGLAALVAAASYGLAFVYQHRYLTGRSWSPAALSAGQLTIATGQVAIFVPVAGTQAIDFRWDAVAALIALGVVSTGIGYVLNYRLVTDEGPAASVVSYLIPIVAVALGWAALGERLTLPVLAGVVVVLAGVALSQQPAMSRGTAERS